MSTAQIVLEYIRALEWPIVIVIAIFRFEDALRSMLKRVTSAKGMGLQLTMQKLELDLPKAERQARQLKTNPPPSDAPKPGDSNE